MRPPIAELRGIGVVFGDIRALDGVEVSLAPGEFVAVTGHSGAGKTTLLSVLAGIVRPDTGTALVGGEHVHDREHSVALGVSLIPQGNALAAALTAYENVLAPLLATGVRRHPAMDRARRALAAVGLEASRGHLVEPLSGGPPQRVAVARGIALEAPILLADEPTSELDHDNRERVLDLLRSRADAGTAVLMATHDPEAAGHADRVLALDDGRLGMPTRVPT